MGSSIAYPQLWFTYGPKMHQLLNAVESHRSRGYWSKIHLLVRHG